MLYDLYIFVMHIFLWRICVLKLRDIVEPIESFSDKFYICIYI